MFSTIKLITPLPSNVASETIVKIKLIKTKFFSEGRVIFQKISQGPAPSIEQAS